MVLVTCGETRGQQIDADVLSFLTTNCNDCHGDGAEEGGFALDALGSNLDDAETFAKWVRVYDRVQEREMPPADYEQPSGEQRNRFARLLSAPLNTAHQKNKATVLRRLNRREYQNTINDLFGVHLDLESMLPEDARSHEFDNVGETLGLSMVHLQRYMDAAELALDAAIAKAVQRPEPNQLVAYYKDTREAERFLGKEWKLLDDGAVVRFRGGGYPSGMLRGSGVRESGRYRVTIEAYAHQSDRSISYSVGGTSFAPGSEKPIYGFYSALPDQPTTIEFEAWIEDRYMLAIEPHGISDATKKRGDPIDQYQGPGLAVGKVTVEGPLLESFPSRGHQLIFDGLSRNEVPPRNPRDRSKSWYVPKFEIQSDDPVGDARRSLRRVASAAFRRNVSGDDVQPFIDLFRRELDSGDTIEESLRTAVTAILCSSNFLFLDEPPGRLDDHALASRLSYFLTRSAPDATLLSLASNQQLQADGKLTEQASRLLSGETSQRFLIDFAESWLDLRELDFTAPDRRLFPEFDSFLRYSMPEETIAFLREMLESNLPIRNLIAADFAMLNNRLAEHYGLPEVDGVTIRKVRLPEGSVRGGLLSQASILKVTANGTNTSPVTRGAWVMERILGKPPQPPPPGVPGVEPDIRGATTLREILAKHRDVESCRACHANIDPPGFALECFNPIGGLRERYRSLGSGDPVNELVDGRRVRYRLGPPVDASGKFVDGKSFSDFQEFRRHLADDPRGIAKTFLVKLLTFATGREMGFSDRPEINRMLTIAGEKDYRARDLLHLAVESQIFRNK